MKARTDRQKDRKTDRQTDGQIGRQTETDRRMDGQDQPSYKSDHTHTHSEHIEMAADRRAGT